MINRRTLLTVVIALILFNVSTLRAQDDVKIEAIPVTDNIYMLTGNGGNIGLFLGNDGTFIVDDQFAPLTDKILAVIKSVGGDTPRFLINTHFHGITPAVTKISVRPVRSSFHTTTCADAWSMVPLSRLSV